MRRVSFAALRSDACKQQPYIYESQPAVSAPQRRLRRRAQRRSAHSRDAERARKQLWRRRRSFKQAAGAKSNTHALPARVARLVRPAHGTQRAPQDARAEARRQPSLPRVRRAPSTLRAGQSRSCGCAKPPGCARAAVATSGACTSRVAQKWCVGARNRAPTGAQGSAANCKRPNTDPRTLLRPGEAAAVHRGRYACVPARPRRTQHPCEGLGWCILGRRGAFAVLDKRHAMSFARRVLLSVSSSSLQRPRS